MNHKKEILQRREKNVVDIAQEQFGELRGKDQINLVFKRR